MSANKDRLNAFIEHLSSIGGEHSDDLRETLDRVAFAIASGMEAEVCSLYLFDPQRERLVLRATVGLDRESVGKVSMRLNEGLVGLVLEKDEPVYVPDAISHQRYKYFPETGEERFHTLLWRAGDMMAQSRSGCWSRKRRSGANPIGTKSGLLSTARQSGRAQILSHFRLREFENSSLKKKSGTEPQAPDDRGQPGAQGIYEKVSSRKSSSRCARPRDRRRPRLAGLSTSPGLPAQGNAARSGTFLSRVSDRHQKSRDPKVESGSVFEEALARSLAELATLQVRMEPLDARVDLQDPRRPSAPILEG